MKKLIQQYDNLFIYRKSIENYIFPKQNIQNLMKVDNYLYFIYYQLYGPVKYYVVKNFFYHCNEFGRIIRKNISKCPILTNIILSYKLPTGYMHFLSFIFKKLNVMNWFIVPLMHFCICSFSSEPIIWSILIFRYCLFFKY